MAKQSVALNRVFAALSDPSRRAIVMRLTRGPASVSELAKPLPMSLPSVVQHLKVLEDSGLVRSAKTGRVRTCRIDQKRFDAAQRWLNEQRTLWEARFDRLDALLEEREDERLKP